MEILNILVSLDINKNNTQLIKFCFEFAKKINARLNFLHCYHPSLADSDLDLDELAKYHLADLNSMVEDSSFAYSNVDYNCEAQPSFAIEGILNKIDDNEYDLIVLAAQTNLDQFGKALAFELTNRTDLPLIIVPDQFRLVDIDHIVFNLEFEFREIEKLFDLLILCDSLGANLSCIHVCAQKDYKTANKNIEVYKRMFEGHLLESMVDFELIIDEKLKSIEKYAVENEADLIVLGKTRKTWKHQYIKTAEEKLGASMNIPVMIIDI